jgi:endoglucanase
MDEIGFMVTNDDGDGLFQFEPVGGIDIRQLPGKPVLIGKEKVPAVIGARAIHLTTAEQRKSAIPLNTLRFDIGPAKSSKVKPGDRATFATKFRKTDENLFGKALDDRLGIVILIEILKNSPEHLDVYYVFSTQEEVGLRGALTAAYQIHPDIGIAVDSTPARDFPSTEETENTKYNTKFGAGPALYTMDSASIADPRLVRHFVQVAEENGLCYQFRQPGPGGTDAGAIHKQHAGIPSISVSVPGRYAHTAIGLASKDDFEKTLQLVYLSLMAMDKDLTKIPR